MLVQSRAVAGGTFLTWRQRLPRLAGAPLPYMAGAGRLARPHGRRPFLRAQRRIDEGAEHSPPPHTHTSSNSPPLRHPPFPIPGGPPKCTILESMPVRGNCVKSCAHPLPRPPLPSPPPQNKIMTTIDWQESVHTSCAYFLCLLLCILSVHTPVHTLCILCAYSVHTLCILGAYFMLPAGRISISFYNDFRDQ